MALVEWADNIAISDEAPHIYWPAQIAQKQITDSALARQQFWHALPDGWVDLPYSEFLAQRRQLMSEVTRTAFEELRNASYVAEYPSPAAMPDNTPAPAHWTGSTVTLFDLIEADLLPRGATLVPSSGAYDVEATVLPDGRIVLDDQIFNTPSGAAGQVTGGEINGWTFGQADTESGRFSLAALRDEYTRLDK